MQDVSRLVLTHWDMVDCLFDEVFLGKHKETLHGPEMLEELFRYFACHDPRFHEAGFRWRKGGFMAYSPPDDRFSDYVGEAAIAAFLGLPLTGGRGGPDVRMWRGNPGATAAAMAVIYKPFDNMLEARMWLRWHVQKLHGYSCKAQDMWLNYPRKFPENVNAVR